MRLSLPGMMRSRGVRLFIAGAAFATYAAFGWSLLGFPGRAGPAGTGPAGQEMRVQSPGVSQGLGGYSWRQARDLWINLLGFLPLGVLLALLWSRLSLPAATALCTALSFLIEAGQLVAPGHFPSVVDLVLNTAGGGMGFWLARLLLARREHLFRASLRNP